MDALFNGEITHQFTMDPAVPNFSPYKQRKFEDDSPITGGEESYSEEELFHLEMSDEGSGGKRSKMDHDIQNLSCQDFGFMGQPQKRGAGHHLGTSTSDITSKKARKTTEAGDAKQTWIQQQQAIMNEEDDDPHMARAAVYYLLLLEDQLASKHFYESKNRIHAKSVSISVQHRRKLLEWLYRVNLQFTFNFDTWVLTASILDRFLSAQPIEKDVFQLAGCAAFLIAAKHEERFPPKISELVDICAKCYNKTDFLKMEAIMLLVLEWKVLSPTVNVLVREVALLQNVKSFTSQFLTNMIQKIIYHKNLAYMPPSKVAFSLVSAADFAAESQDVEKTFKYLLYLLKQDPDDYDDDFVP